MTQNKKVIEVTGVSSIKNDDAKIQKIATITNITFDTLKQLFQSNDTCSFLNFSDEKSNEICELLQSLGLYVSVIEKNGGGVVEYIQKPEIVTITQAQFDQMIASDEILEVQSDLEEATYRNYLMGFLLVITIVGFIFAIFMLIASLKQLLKK